MDSPVELYRAHEYHRAFTKPAAGMQSKSLHRHDLHRSKPPNPHLMECADYLLWSLEQQRDPLLKHGRQAVEMLLSDTCGYNALPSQYKKSNINRKSAQHALGEAGYTHGMLAKRPPRPQSARANYASSAASSSRAGSDMGYPSPSASRSRAAQGRLRSQSDPSPSGPPLARPRSGGQPARETREASQRVKRSPGSGSSQGRPETRQRPEKTPGRQNVEVRAKSARAHRGTQTSFSDRTLSARS